MPSPTSALAEVGFLASLFPGHILRELSKLPSKHNNVESCPVPAFESTVFLHRLLDTEMVEERMSVSWRGGQLRGRGELIGRTYLGEDGEE